MQIFQTPLSQTRWPQWHPPVDSRARSLLLFVQRWGMALAAAAALLAGAPAHAQARLDPGAATGAVMTVPINKSQTLRVERAIGKAVIGNDTIADVLPVSLSSVYVLGKGLGSTNLTLFDKKGNLIAVVDVVVGPDSQGLKKKLAELMPTEAIGVSVSNDTVVLEGTVTSAAAADRAATIAETYAPKKVLNLMSVGTAQQILLEVRFSEMSRATVRQLGISNFQFGDGAVTGSFNGPVPGSSQNYTAGLNFPGGISFTLNALEQQGLVRTLAQPNLIALSGESASFLAGGEFPVPAGISQNGQVSVEFKEFGVSLKFTPTLLEDGLINLVVSPEVSQLDRTAGITLSGLSIPGLKTRRARTTLELRDGQSFAMAGLIQTDFSDTINAIPLLGRLPIIGALFRSTDFNRNETELVIIVTPRIVRPVKAGSTLAMPTDRIQEPSDVDLFLMGKAETRRPVAPTGRLPGPQTGVNAPMPATSATTAANGAATTATSTAKPGGIEGDYGHIVR